MSSRFTIGSITTFICKSTCIFILISMMNLSLEWCGWIRPLEVSGTETRMWCDERRVSVAWHQSEQIRLTTPFKSTCNDTYSPHSWRDVSMMRWRLCVASHLYYKFVYVRGHNISVVKCIRTQQTMDTTTWIHCNCYLDYWRQWRKLKSVLYRCIIQLSTPVFFKSSTANKISVSGNRSKNDTNQMRQNQDKWNRHQ